MIEKEFNIPLNALGKLKLIVSEDDTATRYGSGNVDVFASPAMIALMEKTALESVLQFLPEGYGTVGIAVNIKHIKASPVGAAITCFSKLTGIESKKLTFDVKASDETGLIGMGTHTRFIVNLNEFIKTL